MTSLSSPAAQGVVLVLAATFACGAYKLVAVVVHRVKASKHNLPGPSNPNLILGHFKQVFEEDSESLLFEKWANEYGPNFRLKGLMGGDLLLTFDTRALQHILTHSAQYQKPGILQEDFARTLGNHSLLVVEGAHHRQQRRVMNPAFGPAQIRELAEIFVEKALQLRDKWAAEIAMQGEKGPARINVSPGVTQATLDVIGLAGFGYDFDALSGRETELSRAFKATFAPDAPMTLWRAIQEFVPGVELVFPDERKMVLKEAKEVMRRVGTQLIEAKKAAIRREMAEKNLGLERKDLQGRDLLTLLIKANMATDIPDDQRLSDEDVLAQVPTFVSAGHETTSAATTWALYALAKDAEVQRKLREELLMVETDTPTMDELTALPYLDNVVRETLRLYAPIPLTMRAPIEDDVIPLEKPFVNRHGQMQDNIQISKDTIIMLPILAINKLKSLWGEDAAEFRPERWEQTPEAISSIPGIWAHTLTFIGGPRACIGFRFSIVEMKALLFTLVRAFEYELAVPAEEIFGKMDAPRRPVLRSAPQQGGQLPLFVRPYRSE